VIVKGTHCYRGKAGKNSSLSNSSSIFDIKLDNIKGFNQRSFKSNSSGFQQYKPQEILQMIGRAGRPQFEDQAHAIIMTETSMKNYYQNI
jgi:hypothetical protein